MTITLAGFAAGSATPPTERTAPLILITIDTLRADRVGCLNPASPVETPALDALAADGVVFTRAFTTTPLTLPAHASLMTGLWPMGHGVRDFSGDRLEPDRTTLAETLAQAGFETAGFVSAAVLDHRTGISQGFKTYHDSFQGFLGKGRRVAERSGRQTLDLAETWLESRRGGPYFLWVHLYEPHDPYTPPEPYLSRYKGRPYNGEVAYVDSLVGSFLDYLKRRRLYDPALIAVVSDHGEGLGEHGESRHGFFVYQSTVHVPWIMKLPNGGEAGRRVQDNISLVDFFPTVLQVLKIDRRHWPQGLQGHGRYRLLVTDRPAGSEEVYFETPVPRNHFGWSDLRGIVQGRFKWIAAPRPELYNLEVDPRESSNIFSSNQALGGKYSDALGGLESRYTVHSASPSIVDAELQEQLRSLGYVGLAAPRAETRSRKGLEDPKDKIQIYEKFQAGVEAARQRQWPRAIELLGQAAVRAPRSPAVLSSLAGAYRDSGQWEKATDWFRQVVELRPEDVFTRGEYAQLLIRAGRTGDAAKQLEAALASNPRDFQTLYNLASLRAMSSDFPTAIALFRRAAEVKKDGATLRSLALAEQYAGQTEAAESHLLEALQLDAGDRKAHFQLSQLYQQLGREKEAREHLALSRAP